MAASSQEGMGAKAYAGGVGFRVWAPFAKSVAVKGDFNDWSETANLLTDEGNGYWATDVLNATTGQQYKYVIVNRDTEETIERNDPYAREIDSNNTVIHQRDFAWEEDAFELPPWNEMVIYELHIGTFNDDPSEGPGIFQGVIDKLPYLRDLGINVIEIMAAGEFNADYSWGYNPAFIYAIERSYGGITGFKELVKASHAHGIGVIFDVVYNHLGHPALDMWQFDGWSNNGLGGIYFYNDWRARTPWGHTRLDYGRPEVRQYLRDNALNWLEKRRVDGLRWDATAYIRDVDGNDHNEHTKLDDGWSLMQWINNEVNASQPWKINIAEDLKNSEWITKDTSVGGAGFDSQWDAGFVYKIRDALAAQDDEHRSMSNVRDALYHRYNGDAFKRVIYTESHDEVALQDAGKKRVPELVWPGNATDWIARKRATLGAALVFTAPGIPMIFQGQEWIEFEEFSDQKPLKWSRCEENKGFVEMFRDLIHLRRNWNDNTRGLRGQHINVHHVNDADKLIAFHRWEQGGAGDDVIVIANFANRRYENYQLGFPREGQWRVRFNSDSNVYSSDFGNHAGYDATAENGAKDNMPCRGNIGIGPYSALILSQDN